MGIARGRSCASVLVIPRRKMSLCETLHRRRPWLESELPWQPMGSSPERGRRETGKRKQGHGLGATWGAARGAMGLLLSLLVCAAVAGCFVLAVPEKKEGGRRKREIKKRNEKKREKKKKYGKFSKLENFRREK
jgi:hypothetical protein